MKISTRSQRITQADKDANDQQYYKDHLDSVDGQAFKRNSSFAGVDISESKKLQVNYDLFNNKLNIEDLAYVCQPFGAEVGELPAQMVNRDIVSGKIKAVMGMEAKRPFSINCLAVNEDATTRKEEEEFKRVRDFVISEVMRPIAEEVERKHLEQTQGQKLTPEQEQQLKDQIAQETQAQTPDQVRKYMKREHQDPAEVLNNQILRYLMHKEKIKEKFQTGLKHGLIAGREVFLVGIKNKEPFLKVVNSMYFDYAKTSEGTPIQKSQWGVAEFNMSPQEVISQFRDELTEAQIEDIYEGYKNGMATQEMNAAFDWNTNTSVNPDSVRVLYSAWMGERKVGFLEYYDDNDMPQMMLVSENYKFNPEMGDIDISWEWIPEVHHGYKICIPNTIYIGMGAYPGQHNDLDNLFDPSLPFYGTDYDDMNSETTSAMDRVKGYQYFYDVIMYRIELLMASDKGKIFMMNLNAVPMSAGIDLKKFQYFLEANKIAYYNPQEEANKKGTADVNTVGKVIDLSLVSDITKYWQMAEGIEQKAGQAIGVPAAVEGQASPDESVRGLQSNISQSSNILEPTFQLHNSVKRDVLQALVDLAKYAYSRGKPRKLSYMLDDMSYEMINLTVANMALLASSTIGMFMADATNAAQAKMTVEQLAHAAMQTAQMDLLDVVKVVRAEGIQEAEEALEVGTMRKSDMMQAQAMQQEKAKAEMQKAQQNHEKETWAHEAEMIILKEEERRKTVVQTQTILSLGFNEDKDMDKDGMPDILEVAKHGVDAQIRAREIALAEKKQSDDVRLAEKKIEVDKEKNTIMKNKQKPNS